MSQPMRIQACGTSRLENGSNIVRWKDRDVKEMKDRFLLDPASAHQPEFGSLYVYVYAILF